MVRGGLECSLDLVVLLVLEEVFLGFVAEIVEPDDVLTAEAWALHHAIRFDLVRRDDGAARQASMGDDTHS